LSSTFSDRKRPKPRQRVLDAMSAIEAPFHGSGGFYLRLSALGAVALVAFGVLALRLWSLEVLRGPHFASAAARQSFRVVELPAARGAVVDAKGRTLIATQGRLALTAAPDTLGEVVGGQWKPTPYGRRQLARIAQLSGDTVDTFVRRIRNSLFRSPYAPVEIVPRLSRQLDSFLEENADKFPGFLTAAVPWRSYPQGSLGGGFLGLLGEIGPAQLKDKRFKWAKPGAVIGQSGVEGSYDRILNGGFAKQRVQVDAMGRPVGRLRPMLSAPPRGLQLTIDTRIQRVAERAVADGVATAHKIGHSDSAGGAAVVLDANTGGVVALASYPSFSQIAAARNPQYLGSVSSYNHATQGVYPAGSTFKPIVAEAALADGLLGPSTSLACTGSYDVGGHIFRNVEAGVNAMLTLPEALSMSCDTWFYRVGSMMYRRLATGDLTLQKWAWRLGLGHTTGIDLPAESAGVVPTPAWLKQTQTGWSKTWYEGTSVNLAIGQGYLQITPLQLAVAYAAIANGGTVVRPHLALAMLDPAGHPVKYLEPKPVRKLQLVGLQAIRDGLYAAAHSAGGTSSSIFGTFPIPVSGKTGTAEAPPGSDHSWYASWAPSNHPKYVVVVLIEHGGFGAQAAAPAAKEIYSALFNVKPTKPTG
jgi:penicillin-binding protein 2